jgi:citrate synthase
MAGDDTQARQYDYFDMLAKLAMKQEHTALRDPNFIEKKLFLNVSFYPGITRKAMGVPSIK